VFEETNLSSDSVDEDEPPKKKRHPSKKGASKKPDNQQSQRQKALLKMERQKLESYVKKLNSDELSMRSFDEVRGQTLFKGEDLHAFCDNVDPKR